MERVNYHQSKVNLVWLHGWGQNKEALKPLAEFFSRQCNNHYIDLPGFGQSPPPSKVWNTKDYADYIVDCLNEKKIENFIVIGHSFGGKIAMQLAIYYPQKIVAIVLLAASGLKRKRSFLFKVKAFTLKTTAKIFQFLDTILGTSFKQSYSNKFGSKDYRNARGIMRDILVQSIHEDLSEEVQKIKTHTLLIYGEKDRETPPVIGRSLHHFIKGSSYLELPDQDHYSLLGAGRHQVQSHIQSFLNKVEA